MLGIEARNISKVYRIYPNPKDRFKEILACGRRSYHQEFRALHDVSFRIRVGTTLGLIGDNGSGKSTLLQLVAGVLRPTSGQVVTHGRIAAILELGTGFNPEFTGRENALMSGTIMGIPSKEMARRLPEIAAFAEIGEFLDRPVKLYSSGMYVRLAFAVATSVDPDVLIIDEALAVGDQYFQKRCIDRIEAFRKAGKTILFCSHNLYQIRLISDEVIWLQDGRIAAAGNPSHTVAAYENYLREREVAKGPIPDPGQEGPGVFPWISHVRLSRDGDDAPRDQFVMGEDLTVTVEYTVPQPPTIVHVGVIINRNDDVQVFGTGTHIAGVTVAPHSGRVRLRFSRLTLMAGTYDVSVYLLDEHGLHIYDCRLRAPQFEVIHHITALGLCYLEHQWEVGTDAADGSQPVLQREPARL